MLTVSRTVDTLMACSAALAALAILVRIVPLVTVVVFVPTSGVVVLTRLLAGRIRSYRRARQAAIGSVSSSPGPVFGAVQAVKVANAERGITARFVQLNAQRRMEAVRDSVLSELLHTMYSGTVVLGTAGLLLLMAAGLRTGRFSVGDFALFASYLELVTSLPFRIGVLLAHYQ